jgi:hypothetical protein
LGVEYLRRWHTTGRAGVWRELGQTAENEIFKISTDGDLSFLFAKRESAIREFLGEDSKFLLHTNFGGGGGCVPAGVAIEVPGGTMLIDDVRVGTTILSANLAKPQERLQTKVLRVYRSREEMCMLLDDTLLFTPSQPLYLGNDAWLNAGDVVTGSSLETAEGNPYRVANVKQVVGTFDVYTLTTDHPTHNFLVAGLICKNKQIIDWRL